MSQNEAYVPLSVREGGRRARLGWWWRGRREALALRLAPWFRFVGTQGMAAWDLSQRRAMRVIELEAGLDYALDACDRALRLSENDRGSDGMARQVIRECRDALERTKAPGW